MSSNPHPYPPTAAARAEPAVVGADPQTEVAWYKEAVIYQIHVRAFADSNGDGIGDFDGLTSRLDYIADLGVTAIWLLPFYPSPLRDGGYDIADYRNVNPEYGDLPAFRRFLRQAHRRGLRVITELVMNHTSDQHAWFRRARAAPPGSPDRDFYVWSDTTDRYREARIIFGDYESSNWTWDPVAGAYFWHRFYHHQPDLNFDNPAVRSEMIAALDFWLGMGVDGVRLDAIPYLYEREGTSCENLPETHQFLKELRRHVDERYSDRMLLAEANQWPDDAVAYFGDGDGDECHMAFNFPLMPRLYMAIRREDRLPIIDILDQTPPIPATAQWATFLRNHDELTLEMVTDEERDYMYRVYAGEARMRINLGIRRRLAPLLDGDRRQIELLNALLFSLPGTPVIYYGDELGMGDNVWLGDRDGVRTPMQWSPDRNAGFSSCSPQRLYLPVITESAYHYETVNVEVEVHTTSSLLWWMRQMIALRRRHPQLSNGNIRVLEPDNPKVLSFLRDDVLVVANFSRHAQAVELDLSDWDGYVPVEMFGHTHFAPIGRLPYYVTIGPFGVYWFHLEVSDTEPADVPAEPPSLAHADLFSPRNRALLEPAISRYLPRQRWYGGKDRRRLRVRVSDAVPISSTRDPDAWMLMVGVEYTEGEPETYALPVVLLAGDDAVDSLANRPETVLVRITGDETRVVVDALSVAASAHHVLERLTDTRRARSSLSATTTTSLRRAIHDPEVHVRVASVEQSNTSLVIGDLAIVKFLRRLEAGVHPDEEIGRYLTERGFPNAPRVLGSVHYESGGSTSTVAVAHEFVRNEGDAWIHTLDQLGRMYERVLEEHKEPPPSGAPFDLIDQEPPELLVAVAEDTLGDAHHLGTVVAELHRTLADPTAFGSEMFTPFIRRSLYQTFRGAVRSTVSALRRGRSTLPDDVQDLVDAVDAQEAALLEGLARLQDADLEAGRTRVHGDLHLGQVLWTGKDFVIVDFEGEPNRPLSQRRLRHSPLRDVAGMIRSYHYAAAVSCEEAGQRGFDEWIVSSLSEWGRTWEDWVSARFLSGYLTASEGARYLPPTRGELGYLLDLFVLEKLLYEVRYEMASRPDFVRIPLQRLAAWPRSSG